MHYEHHSHAQTNFGFLGFVDVAMQSVWWGRAYDDPSQNPRYVPRMARLHKLLFGVEPGISRDGQNEDAEVAARIKKELAVRRQSVMRKLQ
jgi:hypothetical protein